MHGTLYIGISSEYANASLAARKLACEYLDEEGFTPIRDFGGKADYYQVGGRCSGFLSLLKLKNSEPKQFAKFWRQFIKVSDSDQAKTFFKKWFPDYRGRIPVCRDENGKVPYLGYPDDAMVIDKALFDQLRDGFSTKFDYSWGLEEKPCALYRDWEDDYQWPEEPEDVIGKIWVVVIDYHF